LWAERWRSFIFELGVFSISEKGYHMSKMDHQSVVRRDAEEVWNSDGDLDRIDELVTDDFVYHNPMINEPVRGPDGYRALAKEFRSAFSDLDMEIDEMFGEDDKLATRYTTRATHTGEIMGIEATNRDIEITGIIVDRLEDGKIKERHVNDDALGLSAQLGMIEPPGESSPR
jgi:steroid delta-isomerase-like uncharacterized protein